MDVASVFGEVNRNTAFEVHRLQNENKELFLSRMFFKYQLEECQRDRDTLVSEVSLLERLVNERQSTNNVEQTRLVARYESHFEKLRAECETERNKTKPLEEQIIELLKHEGNLVKQLADQESNYNSVKDMLELAENEAGKHHNKVAEYEHQLALLQEKYNKEHKDLRRVSALLTEEKEFHQKHKTQFKAQSKKLKGMLADKDMELTTRGKKIGELEATLKDEANKTNFLFKRVSKVDEISSRHHKLFEKYQKAKQAKEVLSKKLVACEQENKEMSKNGPNQEYNSNKKEVCYT